VPRWASNLYSNSTKVANMKSKIAVTTLGSDFVVKVKSRGTKCPFSGRTKLFEPEPQRLRSTQGAAECRGALDRFKFASDL
jgi:hypothetical protein